MKTTLIVAVLAIACGFGAGFWFGRQGRPGASGPASSAAAGEQAAIGRAPEMAAAGSASAGAAASGTGTGTGAGDGGAAAQLVAPSSDADSDAKQAYLKSLAATDPKAAIAWAQANGDEHERDDLYQAIASEWAKRDPEASFAWANGLSSPGERVDAIRGVMEGALEAGHEAVALSFIDRLPPGEYRDRATVAAVKHLAVGSLDRALELVNTVGDSYSMRYAGRAIAEAMLETGGMAQAQRRIESLPYGAMRRELVMGMVERMGDEDVKAAMEWIAQRPTGPEGDEIFESNNLRNLAYSLARDFMKQEGPEEAVAWADRIGDKRARDYYLERLGDAWGRSSPDEASRWLIDAINGGGFDENLEHLAEGILEEWVELDQNAPFENIEQITDVEIRTQLAFKALNELTGENPRVAAERLAEWADADPDLAGRVSSRLMQSWLRRDPEQASMWLSEQEPGGVKDQGIQQLVRSVLSVEKDTATARAWIDEVQADGIRENLLRQVEAVENPAAKKGNYIHMGSEVIYEENGAVLEIQTDGATGVTILRAP